MRKLTSAQIQFLYPNPSGSSRPATPAKITDESKARGARRRRIEELAEEAARESGVDHFGDDDGLPAEESL